MDPQKRSESFVGEKSVLPVAANRTRIPEYVYEVCVP
jgi:hypothetical protein